MKNEILTLQNEIISKKKLGKFDVVVIGILDNLFSQTFSVTINDPNIKYKYLNSYSLCLREEILLKKNFINTFCPEIIDKLMNLDILILSYEKSDILSFENIKTFYHLYYKKLEENEKPINTILIERNNNSKNNKKEINNLKNIKEEKVEEREAKKLAELFNGLFFDCSINDNSFNQMLIDCIEILKRKYNTENYNLFSSEIKDKSNNINFHISIFGNKNLQNLFLKFLLKLDCNSQFIKSKENYYIIKYKNELDDKKNLTIILELMNNNEYSYSSHCILYLYDNNKIENYNSIMILIRSHILNYGAKHKKIYKLFSINKINSFEKEDDIKLGNILAKEIGADFHCLNLGNDENIKEIINDIFNNIIKQLFEYRKLCQTNINDFNKDLIKSKTKDLNNNFYILSLSDSPNMFIDDFINKINEIQSYNEEKFIFNQCSHCYKYINIRIKDESNIIIFQCNNCKTEPIGLDSNQFELLKKKTNKNFYCDKCQKCLYYNYSSKKLICPNCQYNYKALKSVEIPIYLKDYYCEKHNQFHQYYLKFSKQGICINCLNEKYKKGYFIEKYNEKLIKELIRNKYADLEKEKLFLSSIKQKFKKCIKDLELKFEEMMKIKENIFNIKKNMIKNLELIENNYTLISNVENLKFNYMRNFQYNEYDSIENKIKNIFNYLNITEDKNNFYFNKNKENNSLAVSGPYNNLNFQIKNKNNEWKENKYIVTDMQAINDNKLICISFNDGKAKIYCPNINDFYPKIVINEYEPLLGVNSLYVSKNKDNKDIIFLSGFEKIKIIQLKDDFQDYNLLKVIIKENNNIYQIIELSFDRSLLYLNDFYEIELIKFKNDIYDFDDKSTISLTNLFIKEDEFDNPILSINKYSEFILGINISYPISIPKLKLKESLAFSGINGLTLVINESLNIQNENILNENYYQKIYKIGLKKLLKENEKLNDIIVLNEYKIPNNYELLGILSEEKNLLLMHYKKKDENYSPIIFIFDFNICQFIKSFKYQNNFVNPKLFSRINSKCGNFGFIICDENINLYQYLYDKDSPNNLYRVKVFETKTIMDNIPIKLICLEKSIIILCKKNIFYLLSE